MANGAKMDTESDNKIDDVDEIFESFVKKKLQQLGIKRAAAKSMNNGTMNELEKNIKMRLEQNLTNGPVNLKEEPVPSMESEYQPPVPLMVKKKDKKNKKSKKKKKEKKKKREKENNKKWKERKDDPGKNKKEKTSKKKKKEETKSEKNSATTTPKISLLDTKPSEPDPSKHDAAKGAVAPIATIDNKNSAISPQFHSDTTVKTETVCSKNRPSDTVLQPKVVVKNDENKATVALSTPLPKKDIATIKMKVELLKARNAKEEVCDKTNSLTKASEDEKGETGKIGSKTTTLTSESMKRHSSSSSRSRSRSRKRSRRHSRHHSRSRSRSGSRKPTKRSHHRSRSPHRHTHHRKHRSRSNERHGRNHKTSSSNRRKSRRSSSPLISAEDKVRLLEIARANALAQHKATSAGASISNLGQMVKAGSMSVRELTSMCKDIADGKEMEPSDTPLTKKEAEKLVEDATAKVHHPFAIRETPIVFSIKPSPIPAPPMVSKPVAVLSKEFPVSCGQQHRRKEVLESVYGKWEVVAKDEATKNAVKELVSSEKVFVEPEPVEMDLSSVIAERISAARQLQENPNSQEAQSKMSTVQQRIDVWTKSKQVIGQFTGTSGIQKMPRAQLEGGRQAWFKQEDFKNAKHVSGIGKSLLQKMGWKPGTPLGKTMLGQIEPLSLSVKNDRRGLSSFMEAPLPSCMKKGHVVGGAPGGVSATMKDLSDKHPVSALMEVCSKRHWPPPEFSLVDPCNTKIFTFKVTVCNDEYNGQPASNKKQAKLKAAAVALQCMGLVPRTLAT